MQWNSVNERDILYFLLKIPGLGRKRIWAIYEAYGSFAAAMEEWDYLIDQLKLKEAMTKSLGKSSPLEWILRLSWERMTDEIQYLCFLDQAFPRQVSQIPDPPLAFFYRGDLSLLHEYPAVGVVGSRKPTPYGRAACAHFAKDLAQRGFVIVSGLAYGIDGEAHVAALKAGGKTIGVMGCGIDQIYPTGHRKLYEQMESFGLILSEYAPGTPSVPGLFADRNRIISGLSLGVLVVEAAERSGSLITADCALEQGKDVFVVPGPIFSEMSAGTNNLIKQGAKLVTTSKDIWEEWPHLFMDSKTSINIERTRKVSMDDREQAVYDLLTEEGVHADQLLERVSISERKMLHQTLLVLESKGIVISLPGGYFARR